MDSDTVARFWPKVDKSGSCWEWTAMLDRDGYGVFKVDGKLGRAHRVSYEIHYGPVPSGKVVCHSCDNRKCVNPEHLSLGTVADNNRQRAARNPVGRVDNHSPRRAGTLEERFSRFFEKTEGCWEWAGSKDAYGYGRFKINLVNHKAHRVAYELFVGAIEGDLCVLHRCDNPGCVRSDHLFLGTRADNASDRVEKGRGRQGPTPRLGPGVRSSIMKRRAARGDQHGSKTHPEKWVRGDDHWSRQHPEKRATGDRHGSKTKPESILKHSGEKSPTAKLTAAQVDQIRVEYSMGNVSQDSLAQKYKVGQAQISRIIHGKRWAQ